LKPEQDIEADRFDEYALDQLAKKGAPYNDVVGAIKEARRACESAGLNCHYDEEGAPYFTEFQTAKAVRHTREDVSATLLLQGIILARLNRNRKYNWLIIALLLYIASQVGQ
jgi:hypothetical protein